MDRQTTTTGPDDASKCSKKNRTTLSPEGEPVEGVGFHGRAKEGSAVDGNRAGESWANLFARQAPVSRWSVESTSFQERLDATIFNVRRYPRLAWCEGMPLLSGYAKHCRSAKALEVGGSVPIVLHWPASVGLFVGRRHVVANILEDLAKQVQRALGGRAEQGQGWWNGKNILWRICNGC